MVNFAQFLSQILHVSSGTGKTTLLNILTGLKTTGGMRVDGLVTFNGERLTPTELRRTSAYVQQNDLFIGTLTVWEHLQFHALLKMGGNNTARERAARVTNVIKELGLAKCQDTMIGTPTGVRGISGGERKRLAFASEILTNPAVMFCDEPTSGVDSHMAQQIVNVLQTMAAQGKTIICTIHQPSSQVFAMFDKICLMAEGRIAYLGPTDQAADIFLDAGYRCPRNFNPADHYVRTLALQPRQEADSRLRIREICRSYENSDIAGANREAVRLYSRNINRLKDGTSSLKSGEHGAYKASWLVQFLALCWRSLLTTLREPMLLRVRLIQTMLIGITNGLVFWQTEVNAGTVMTINGVLYQLVLNVNFLFIFAIVQTFCHELPVFLREHFSGIYRVDAYYLAKMVAEFPQYLFLPFLYCTIVYWMSGLYGEIWAFLINAAICVLVANVGISFAYAISCIAGDINIALILNPVITIPLMLFGGFFINQDTIPPYFNWIKYVSQFRYGFEALSINQWTRVGNITGCEDGTCPPHGVDTLSIFGFDQNNLIPDVLILIVEMLFVRFIGFAALLTQTYARARY